MAAGPKEQNLIVNLTFNPPFISIVGPIKETTIQKLNTVLPESTTSTQSASQKYKFAMQRREDPPCWFGHLHSSFANEDVGQSRLMLSLLDALEDEGDWKLKGSNSMSHDVDKVTYKFFFVRKL
jgi:hypothetical protein